MLQDHDFKHLLGLGIGEFVLGDEGGYMGGQGMDTLIGELVDIGEMFVPEIFLNFYSSIDGIMGFPGHLLVLWGDGPIVD